MAEKISGAEFLRTTTDGGKTREPKDDADARNIKRARDSIGYIQTLKQSLAFQWFEQECIINEFEAARAKLTSETTKPEELPVAQKVFHRLLGVRVWLLEREIVVRQELDREDKEIEILQMKVNALKK